MVGLPGPADHPILRFRTLAEVKSFLPEYSEIGRSADKDKLNTGWRGSSNQAKQLSRTDSFRLAETNAT